MGDPQYVNPRAGPFSPPWPPPAPYPQQAHPHFMYPASPFSAMQAFVPGFASQHQNFNPGHPPFPPTSAPPPFSLYGSPPAFSSGHGPLRPFPAHRIPPPGPPPSGMVPPVLSPVHAVSKIGVSADSIPYNRNSLTGPTRVEDAGLVKHEEGINVIEQAIVVAQEEKTVDVKDLLSQIRELVTEAEDAVEQMGKLVKIDPSMSESNFVTCPFHPNHRVSPEALFKHFLCCASTHTPQLDFENLVSSLQYPQTLPQDFDRGSVLEDKDRDLPSGTSMKDGENSLVVFDPESNENVTAAGIQVNKASEKDSSLVLGVETDEMSSKTGAPYEIDIWGCYFFYKDSPAVVQIPFPSMPESESLVQFTNAVDQFKAKVELTRASESGLLAQRIGCRLGNRGSCEDALTLLPSKFWFLLRETEMWTELPTRCSSLVLQAAMGLGNLRKKGILKWLLMQGPAHGVVLGTATASHIYTLAKFCLKTVEIESSTLVDDLLEQKGRPSAPQSDNSHAGFSLDEKDESSDRTMLESEDRASIVEVKKETGTLLEEEPSWNVGRSLEVTCVDCSHLFQSGHWLTSLLFPLFGPSQSKAIVLTLFKHCLVSSGRFLASSFLDASSRQGGVGVSQHSIPQGEKVEKVIVDGGLQSIEEEKKSDDKLSKFVDDSVEESLLPLNVEAAIAAVHERAVLESYLKTLINAHKSTKFQMIQEHEAAVALAAEERSKRPNFRPVSEYDGLIWHRSQLEEKNRNKTREEQLAEERDYKRRRMSYRGKKLKRNPTQVLHDIIAGHMEEIVEAGGIACFTKHPGEVLPSPAETFKIERSIESSLLDPDDVIKPKLQNDDLSLVATSSKLDSKSKKEHWKENPDRRHERSNGHSMSIRFSEDSNYNCQQVSTYSRLDVGNAHDDYKGSSRYKGDHSPVRSHRHDSHQNSDRLETRRPAMDNKRSQPRYRSDHDRDMKEPSEDRYESSSEKIRCTHTGDRYASDYENDWSHSQRRIEDFSKDDGIRRHSSDYELRGKSKSRH